MSRDMTAFHYLLLLFCSFRRIYLRFMIVLNKSIVILLFITHIFIPQEMELDCGVRTLHETRSLRGTPTRPHLEPERIHFTSEQRSPASPNRLLTTELSVVLSPRLCNPNSSTAAVNESFSTRSNM